MQAIPASWNDEWANGDSSVLEARASKAGKPEYRRDVPFGAKSPMRSPRMVSAKAAGQVPESSPAAEGAHLYSMGEWFVGAGFSHQARPMSRPRGALNFVAASRESFADRIPAGVEESADLVFLFTG